MASPSGGTIGFWWMGITGTRRRPRRSSISRASARWASIRAAVVARTCMSCLTAARMIRAVRSWPTSWPGRDGSWTLSVPAASSAARRESSASVSRARGPAPWRWTASASVGVAGRVKQVAACSSTGPSTTPPSPSWPTVSNPRGVTRKPTGVVRISADVGVDRGRPGAGDGPGDRHRPGGLVTGEEAAGVEGLDHRTDHADADPQDRPRPRRGPRRGACCLAPTCARTISSSSPRSMRSPSSAAARQERARGHHRHDGVGGQSHGSAGDGLIGGCHAAVPFSNRSLNAGHYPSRCAAPPTAAPTVSEGQAGRGRRAALAGGPRRLDGVVGVSRPGRRPPAPRRRTRPRPRRARRRSGRGRDCP